MTKELLYDIKLYRYKKQYESVKVQNYISFSIRGNILKGQPYKRQASSCQNERLSASSLLGTISMGSRTQCASNVCTEQDMTAYKKKKIHDLYDNELG